MIYEYIIYLYLFSYIIFGQERIQSHIFFFFSGGYKPFKHFNVSYIHVFSESSFIHIFVNFHDYLVKVIK